MTTPALKDLIAIALLILTIFGRVAKNLAFENAGHLICMPCIDCEMVVHISCEFLIAASNFMKCFSA